MIKKFSTLLFVIMSFLVFSQVYHFDYMLKSITKREDLKVTFKSYDMVNSKNHDIYLEIGQNSQTFRYYAIIIDNDEWIDYRFQLTKPMVNPISFDYLYSIKRDKKRKEVVRYSNLKIEKIDDLSYRIYPEKVKRKNEFDILIKLEKSEADLIIFYFETFSHKQELAVEKLLKQQLILDGNSGNFYIKEYKFNKKGEPWWSTESVPQKIDVNIDFSQVELIIPN